MWGPTFPELIEALPGIEIIDRSSVNAFDDMRVARAIEATGRKKLIFAGISLEVCAAFPAMTAIGKGLDAYVAVDASGTFSVIRTSIVCPASKRSGVLKHRSAHQRFNSLSALTPKTAHPFPPPHSLISISHPHPHESWM